MNIEGKSLTPILLVLVVLLLCVTVFSLFSLKGEKAEKTDLQLKLEQTGSMIDTLKSQLGESNKTVLQLSEQIEDRSVQIETLSTELDSVKTNSEIAISEGDGFRLEIENLKVSKQGLLEKLNIAEKELEKVKSELLVIAKEKDSLEQKLKDLQASSGISLDKIVVSSSVVEEGNVLEVNKEYDFIVVDLGQKDNIKLGQILYIYQGSDFLGEATIDKIHEMMSVATFEGPKLESALKQGDTVKLKK